MGLPDFFHELGPTQFARTGRSLTPVAKATSRNLEDTTQNFDGELSLVIADEGKFHDCSFAKNAVAFFNGYELIRRSPGESIRLADDVEISSHVYC